MRHDALGLLQDSSSVRDQLGCGHVIKPQSKFLCTELFFFTTGSPHQCKQGGTSPLSQPPLLSLRESLDPQVACKICQSRRCHLLIRCLLPLEQKRAGSQQKSDPGGRQRLGNSSSLRRWGAVGSPKLTSWQPVHFLAFRGALETVFIPTTRSVFCWSLSTCRSSAQLQNL